MALTRRVRRQLQIQGFACPTDEEFERLAPWLRFSPVACSAAGAVGTLLASPALLVGLAATAVVGAVTGVHPFDTLYNHGIRRLTRTDSLPRNATPRRFACAVATVWLLATAGAFRSGRDRLGRALGALFVLTSGLNAAYVCVPSMVYRALTGWPADSSPGETGVDERDAVTRPEP
ncbi:DUF4395 family protein [Halobacteriaceae archaeon GCM10025711]